MKFIALFTALFVATAAYGDIKTVIGVTPADYAERYRHTYRIEKNLDGGTRATLEAFLRRMPKDDVLTIDELAALKNNVADALIEQDAMPESTLDLFVAMYTDQALGEVWHGYIVQKVAELTQRLKSPEKIDRAVAFLWSQVTDLNAPFPAEAALGLNRLHAARPDLVAKEDMARRLAAFVAAKEPRQETKRIVLQVLTKFDPATARKEALRFLAAADSGIMLKSSALATLGMVGQPEDRAAMEPYLSSPDIRLSEAASVAIRKLR